MTVWPNSNRRQRHGGKHGGSIEGARVTHGELLADVLAPAQAGTAGPCSPSTLAWLRSERDIALGSADDHHGQAMQLLELEKVERARAADLERLLLHRGAGPIPPMGELWRPPSETQVPQVPQVDLTGVLAAAKHDAGRVAAVTNAPLWPGLDDAPLYGHLTAAHDGHTRELATVDGAA